MFRRHRITLNTSLPIIDLATGVPVVSTLASTLNTIAQDRGYTQPYWGTRHYFTSLGVKVKDAETGHQTLNDGVKTYYPIDCLQKDTTTSDVYDIIQKVFKPPTMKLKVHRVYQGVTWQCVKDNDLLRAMKSSGGDGFLWVEKSIIEHTLRQEGAGVSQLKESSVPQVTVQAGATTEWFNIQQTNYNNTISSTPSTAQSPVTVAPTLTQQKKELDVSPPTPTPPPPPTPTKSEEEGSIALRLQTKGNSTIQQSSSFNVCKRCDLAGHKTTECKLPHCFAYLTANIYQKWPRKSMHSVTYVSKASSSSAPTLKLLPPCNGWHDIPSGLQNIAASCGFHKDNWCYDASCRPLREPNTYEQNQAIRFIRTYWGTAKRNMRLPLIASPQQQPQQQLRKYFIHGTYGCGKTTLLKRLEEQLMKYNNSVLRFDAQIPSKHPSLASVRGYDVVMIDNAQFLSVDVLEKFVTQGPQGLICTGDLRTHVALTTNPPLWSSKILRNTLFHFKLSKNFVHTGLYLKVLGDLRKGKVTQDFINVAMVLELRREMDCPVSIHVGGKNKHVLGECSTLYDALGKAGHICAVTVCGVRSVLDVVTTSSTLVEDDRGLMYVGSIPEVINLM